MRPASLILAAALGVLAFPALAAQVCSPPADLAPAPVLSPRPDEVVTGVITAYYLLAISWTPQWCRTIGQKGTEQAVECGKPLGFTLHGLWPNGTAPPYPRYCRPVGGLDAGIVRRMYCRTPSAALLQHEWQAHGACGWPDARAYFAASARLFDRVVLPRIEAIPAGGRTAGALRAAFIAKNPWLRRETIFVATTRGEDLTEVRLCYDLKYRPAACPGGNGAPDGAAIHIAPSHTGAF